MKKLFLLVSSMLIFIEGYTQKATFGAEAGINLAGATVKYPTYDVKDGRPQPGLIIGGFADIPLISKQISFRPSLLYSLERASEVVEGDKAKINVSFINIPLDMIYHPKPGQRHLFYGIGPFLAFNLGGKYDWAGTRKQSIAFGSDSSDFGRSYKRFDLGIDLLAGYQLNKKISISAKFDYGLLNMSHTTEDPEEAKLVKIHTLCFGITAGYFFNVK